MSNVTKFAVSNREVLLSNDSIALAGAALRVLTRNPDFPVSRFGILKDSRVLEVLKSAKVNKEPEQLAQIGKVFSELHAKGFVVLSGEKAPKAQIVSGYADLAKEVVDMAEKIELPKVEAAKRGRPAGTGAVNRNPLKAKRFWLVDGKVQPFGVGKPNKDKLLAECDENGKIIADIAAINALYDAREADKAMKVQRNPTVSKATRFYLKNGVVTPFGLGKPGIEKLSNECTKDGEMIDNSERVALMRQPKQSSGSTGGNTSKISALEAQIAQLTAMMTALVAGGIPQQVQAVTFGPDQWQSVEEVVEPAEIVAEKPAKAAKADKPAKSAKAKKIVEEDPYETFVNGSAELDAEPVAFGSDGFVVTEIDC